MISRTAFCSAQPRTMRSARFGPMPPTSFRRSGLASMISKVCSPKSGHDALGHGRADAAHVAGGEVLLDPRSPRGRGGLQHLGLELQAVLAVGEPDAGGGDPLARADGRRVSDEGDEVALAARLHLQDGKAGLGIVEGDALDRARQRLFRRTSGGLRSADSHGGHEITRAREARERIGCPSSEGRGSSHVGAQRRKISHSEARRLVISAVWRDQARQLLSSLEERPERLQPAAQPDLEGLLCASLARSMAPGFLAERTGPRPQTVRAVIGHGPDLDRSDVSRETPERHARDPVLGATPAPSTPSTGTAELQTGGLALELVRGAV